MGARAREGYGCPKGIDFGPNIHRGDRGSRYLFVRYTERWRRAALGSRWGALAIRLFKARAESIIGLYQTAVILARRPWRDLEPVEFARLEWVHSFNHRRLLEVVGNRPPAEAKADCHRQRDHTALAA